LIVAPKASNVHFDGLFHVSFSRFSRSSRGDTSRKVWGIGRIIFASLFDDDKISDHGSIVLLQTGLLEDAVQSNGSQVVILVSGDCHPSQLGRMLVLAMAPFMSNLIPAVLPEHSHGITDFHREYRLRLSLIFWDAFDSKEFSKTKIGGRACTFHSTLSTFYALTCLDITSPGAILSQRDRQGRFTAGSCNPQRWSNSHFPFLLRRFEYFIKRRRS